MYFYLDLNIGKNIYIISNRNKIENKNYIGDFGTKYLAKELSYLIKLTYLVIKLAIKISLFD